MSEIILGVNCFHGDSSAALLKDGKLVAGVDEERLNRIKHWAGFPKGAILSCLEQAGVDPASVDHVAVSRDPSAHLLKKALFAFQSRPGFEAIRSRLMNQRRVSNLSEVLSTIAPGLRPKVHHVEHHRAHLASAFLCSPFDEAACLTVDGFGDFVSSMSCVGRGREIAILDEVMFPHSLGILYTAVTQFIGFPKYGYEYKVMGLAAYGKPAFLPTLRKIVTLLDDGRFETDVDYFRHASEGVTMSWEDGEPAIGQLWSERLGEVLGPPRVPGAEIEERHRDIAASLQSIYEEAFFHRVRALLQRTGLKTLCLAGGCALNSVANGKLFEKTDVKDVYIQSAAGDGGTSLGAALYVRNQVLGRSRGFVMEHSYWGPEYGEARVVSALRGGLRGFDGSVPASGGTAGGFQIRRYTEENLLFRETAGAIAAGEIVGWYQGRSEWGPRALGNRSIVVDPRRAEMKDILNARIKRREPFRPFAPSVLEERTGEWFQETYPDPFMIKVYPIRSEKRGTIPAVTHVDGTGRLQTVSRRQNPRYWGLIRAFEEITGIPIVLNTSFNENEPIVNTPEEALDCFLRTKMNRIVLGDWAIWRLD